MNTSTACRTVVGVFKTRAAAEQAYAKLRAEGYREEQIGFIGKDVTGRIKRNGAADGNNAGEGAAIGAAVGAMGGAAVGAGILMGVIPVIGPVLAIGTLGTVLLNAAGGAAIAGIAGALVGWGIPEEDADYYEKQVESGYYLVTVSCGEQEDPWDVMTGEGAYTRSNSPTV